MPRKTQCRKRSSKNQKFVITYDQFFSLDAASLDFLDITLQLTILLQMTQDYEIDYEKVLYDSSRVALFNFKDCI